MIGRDNCGILLRDELTEGDDSMRWTARDIDLYFREKDYIDTAVVPLVPVTWHREIKSTVSSGEFIVLIVDELERQLKGRIIHFPPFSYLNAESMATRVERLRAWKQELLDNELRHVFFITADVSWKRAEKEVGDSLLWLPAVPLEHMSPDNRRETIAGQIKQLLEIITIKWQNSYNYE